MVFLQWWWFICSAWCLATDSILDSTHFYFIFFTLMGERVHVCKVFMINFADSKGFSNDMIHISGYLLILKCKSEFLAHLSRRLMGELIVYQSLRRPSVVCRPSSVRPSVHNFKHLLLWNHWANLIQISYGDSLGRGNKSLFKWSWSHDQDGRHAHIW